MVRSPEKGVRNFPTTEKLISDIDTYCGQVEDFLDLYDSEQSVASRELLIVQDDSQRQVWAGREEVVDTLREYAQVLRGLVRELREFKNAAVKQPGEKETQQRARRNFRQIQALMQTTRSWGIHG